MNHAQRRRPRFLWTATLAGQKPPRRRNHNHHPPLLSEGISKVDQAVIKVMSTSDRGLGRGKRPDITLPLRCIDDTGSLRIAILCLCRNQPSKFDQAPRQTLGLRLKGSLGAPLERARTQRHKTLIHPPPVPRLYSGTAQQKTRTRGQKENDPTTQRRDQMLRARASAICRTAHTTTYHWAPAPRTQAAIHKRNNSHLHLSRQVSHRATRRSRLGDTRGEDKDEARVSQAAASTTPRANNPQPDQPCKQIKTCTRAGSRGHAPDARSQVADLRQLSSARVASPNIDWDPPKPPPPPSPPQHSRHHSKMTSA